MQRKCACGGSAGLSGECEECVKKRMSGVQTKLAIGEAGDKYEQEADRTAEQVLATPAHATIAASPPRIQRLAAPASGQVDSEPASVHRALASPGMPLEPRLRLDMEQRFAHDFSKVRVHTGAAAEQSARDVNAHAYTVGEHIVFGAGRFAPEVAEGRRLFAHELTHVLQQSGGHVLQRSPDEAKKPEEKPPAKLAGCSEDQQKTLTEAIAQAKSLAGQALRAFTREYPLSHEVAAMRDHFGSLGSDQKATIVERYKDVLAKVDGKSYTCAKRGKKVRAGTAIVDLCGEASCPGSAVTLYPDFGKATCPAGPVLLHEALHNAGACDDIDKGRGYPPSSSEDNAYSYEYFALAVATGLKTPELGKRRPQAPKIKD